MRKNLVIVESPAKAKTIEGYLGKDYEVKSSNGHVRNLPKDNSAIDVANGFTPVYEITKDSRDVIRELRELAEGAEFIYLASDDDREGEAISWHLAEALELSEVKIRRIVFREITRNAIHNAIQNPRGIDRDLVNAQQARRILDRLVGFELSPVLWEKVRGGLSAGRVQSVAVRLVVEREREIVGFVSKSFFRVVAWFGLDGGKVLRAELPEKFDVEEGAMAFLGRCKNATFVIENVEIKPLRRSPAPPFTTSTLQQEASRKLGFSVSKTMRVAQNLYESGKISYMRTDSLALSDEAMRGAADAIEKGWGDRYVKRRVYKTKNKNAQEAHEAIRPTDFSQRSVGMQNAENKLYDLIWKRSIASQMADAQLEQTTATIGISTTSERLIAKGEVVKFDGFLRVYVESTDDEFEEGDKKMLPPLSIGQVLILNNMLAKQGFTRHPPRYTEASLVKKLEEMGIGRPSTYAPTISIIQKRNYIEKGNREGYERKSIECLLEGVEIKRTEVVEITGVEKNKLFPTNTAVVVNDFLVDHFPDVIDYGFTAEVEQQFDDIASGKVKWDKMLDAFYGDFHHTVEKSLEVDRSIVNRAREIGTDPQTGKKVYAMHGRFGAYLQIGDFVEGQEKPRRASLSRGQFLDSLTLDDALDLFKLPREVGEFEGNVMTIAMGRYGPYIRHGGKYVSLEKTQDPLAITTDEAIQLILEKRQRDANKYIKIFSEDPELSVLNGRYGPYIRVGKKNVRIPKGVEPENLTYVEAKKLVAKAREKKGRSRSK